MEKKNEIQEMKINEMISYVSRELQAEGKEDVVLGPMLTCKIDREINNEYESIKNGFFIKQDQFTGKIHIYGMVTIMTKEAVEMAIGQKIPFYTWHVEVPEDERKNNYLLLMQNFFEVCKAKEREIMLAKERQEKKAAEWIF